MNIKNFIFYQLFGVVMLNIDLDFDEYKKLENKMFL